MPDSGPLSNSRAAEDFVAAEITGSSYEHKSCVNLFLCNKWGEGGGVVVGGERVHSSSTDTGRKYIFTNLRSLKDT